MVYSCGKMKFNYIHSKHEVILRWVNEVSITNWNRWEKVCFGSANVCRDQPFSKIPASWNKVTSKQKPRTIKLLEGNLGLCLYYLD